MADQKGQGASEFILKAEDIVKEFSGVRVLDHVGFELKRGEVHALLGENGAGKSTLMKIITGVYQRTEGIIRLDGQEVTFGSKSESEDAGIGMIFQELSMVPCLSVAENLFLGNEKKKKIAGVSVLDWKEMRREASKWMQEFGVELDVRLPVNRFGVAKQQLIEIIKAIMRNTRVLIMDEPTSALTSEEIEYLFSLIRELKKKGTSVIYISHRMEEMKQICDRATVLRDGRNVATVNMADTSMDEIISMMVGKELHELYPEKTGEKGEVLLEAKNLSSPHRFDNISFQLHAGEVLGVTGLVGAGKTELARALFGADHGHSGEVRCRGEVVQKFEPGESLRHGIALVPEDRKFQGIITKLRADENIGLPSLKRYCGKLGIIRLKTERKEVERFFGSIDIRPFEPKKKVQFFSGGNQQKIAISKWLATDARIYIFDEPTRGIDIGAKAEIYRLIRDMAKQGCGILVCTSEIEESLGICDRIIVLNRGRMVATVDAAEADIGTILKLQIDEEKAQ